MKIPERMFERLKEIGWSLILTFSLGKLLFPWSGLR